MIFYKTSIWTYVKTSWEKVVSQSEYDKATIVYEALAQTPIVIEKEIGHTVVDAYGNTIVLWTKTITEPVVEIVEVDIPVLDKEWNPVLGKKWEVKTQKWKKEQQCVKEEIKKVRYNQYDNWYIIIPDDATIVSEEEYNKEIENMTIFKDIK